MSDSLLIYEPQILRYFIDNPDAVDKDDNPFISKDAQGVYKGLIDLIATKAAITTKNLAVATQKYAPNVGIETLSDLQDIKYDDTDIEFYRRRVKEEALKTDIEENLLDETLRLVSRKGELDVDSLRENVSKLNDAIDAYAGRSSQLVTGKQLILSLSDELEKRDAGLADFPTGDGSFDHYMTYGFSPSAQTTIFSQTGIGKTQVKLHIINQRINLFLPTLDVELEMDNVPIAERLVSMRHDMPYRLFHPKNTGGQVPPNIKSLVKREAQSLEKNRRFLNVNEAEMSIDDLRTLVREAKKYMGVDYLVMFLDLTTMLKDFNEGSGDMNSRYTAAVDKLHYLSRAENIHIVNIVQANRDMVSIKIKEPDDVDDIIPQIKHVKNSSAFAERSRTLIGLHRKKYYLEQMFPEDPQTITEENIMEVWFLKQNGGPLGKAKYLYRPEMYSLLKYIDDDGPGNYDEPEPENNVVKEEPVRRTRKVKKDSESGT